MDRPGYLHGSKDEIIAFKISGNGLLYHSYQMLLYNKNSIYIMELQNKRHIINLYTSKKVTVILHMYKLPSSSLNCITLVTVILLTFLH